MNRLVCQYMQLTLLEAEVMLAYWRIWVRLLGKLKQPVPGQTLNNLKKKKKTETKPQEGVQTLHFFSLIEHLTTTFRFRTVEASSRYLWMPKDGEAYGFLKLKGETQMYSAHLDPTRISTGL